LIAYYYNFYNATINGLHFKGNHRFYVNKLGYLVEDDTQSVEQLRDYQIDKVYQDIDNAALKKSRL
jgi:hypothetical protein